MASGYVYILINHSMPGMLKIGCTLRDSRARARKLFTTGVPTPFEVAFEVFSEDHEKLEAQIHAHLLAFRVNGDREFFRYPLKDAISLLQQLSGVSMRSRDSFAAVSILAELKRKYPAWMHPSIADVQIVQTDERVWLEITTEEEIAGYLKDQTIKRTDLGFICADDVDLDNALFSFTDPVTENTRKFTEEFDPFSIVNITDLFHEAACREVFERFNPHRQRENFPTDQ